MVPENLWYARRDHVKYSTSCLKPLKNLFPVIIPSIKHGTVFGGQFCLLAPKKIFLVANQLMEGNKLLYLICDLVIEKLAISGWNYRCQKHAYNPRQNDNFWCLRVKMMLYVGGLCWSHFVWEWEGGERGSRVVIHSTPFITITFIIAIFGL